MINGIINVYKERGFTSHDVVAKMRGICGQKKIGHTGTLDPYATGVLPVCLGNGTKLCDVLTDKDKEYVAELLLGVETDTQDITGEVIHKAEVSVTKEQVVSAIESFVGEYMQIPPMYSAIKIGGKKLYELAREGKTVEREARKVEIKAIEILAIDLPVIKMRVECSKGTYIRTLCNDIGEKLGCHGTMQSLERTRVGRFTLENAVTLTQLQEWKDQEKLSEGVTSVEEYFSDLPSVYVKKEFKKLIDNGNSFRVANVEDEVQTLNMQNVKAYCGDTFYGLYRYENDRKLYMPVKMFLGNE